MTLTRPIPAVDRFGGEELEILAVERQRWGDGFVLVRAKHSGHVLMRNLRDIAIKEEK